MGTPIDGGGVLTMLEECNASKELIDLVGEALYEREWANKLADTRKRTVDQLYNVVTEILKKKVNPELTHEQIREYIRQILSRLAAGENLHDIV